MRAFLLLPLFFLALPSCDSLKRNYKKLDAVETKIKDNKTQLDEKTKIYVDGAMRALSSKKTESLSAEDKLALRLLTNAQNIVGLPEPDKQIRVDLVLSDDSKEKEKLMLVEKSTAELLLKKTELQAEKEKINQEIHEKARELVATKKGFFETLKDNIVYAILFIGVGVLLVYFGPALLRLVKTLIKPI